MRKRTLRAKIVKLLDDILKYNCGKLVAFSKRDEELTEIEK